MPYSRSASPIGLKCFYDLIRLMRITLVRTLNPLNPLNYKLRTIVITAAQQTFSLPLVRIVYGIRAIRMSIIGAKGLSLMLLHLNRLLSVLRTTPLYQTRSIL